MKALSRDEFESLLFVAEKHNKRDALMFRIIMQHCMRITEVVGGWAKLKKGAKYFHEGITAKSIVDGIF